VCYYDNRQYELAEEILEKNLLKDSSRKNAMDILLMVIVLAAKGETAEGVCVCVSECVLFEEMCKRLDIDSSCS
jgi:hypothetical protein